MSPKNNHLYPARHWHFLRGDGEIVLQLLFPISVKKNNPVVIIAST